MQIAKPLNRLLCSSAIGLSGLFALVFQPVIAAPGDILFQEEFDSTGDYISDWTSFGFGTAAVTTATFSSSPRALQTGGFAVTVTSRSGRIDTSGIDGADVTAWIRRGDDSFSENPDAGEDLTFQYLNSSGTWIDIASYIGEGTPGEIYTPTFSLPADGLYSTLQIRFVQASGSLYGYDYWHMDDVIVTETGPGGDCLTTYSDLFDSSNYNNNDGTLDWTAETWSETNDDGSASSGLISISSGQLELSGNGTSSNTAITRQVDTDSATSIALSFDFQMVGGVDTGDSSLVEISDDGGSSWTTLETFTGFANNSSGSRSYTVTTYAASNMQVRFAISPDSGGDCCYDSGGERWEIDNLVIEYCVITLPDPIAEYRLDEDSWDGSAGEVIDSSGNGLNGRSVNLNDLPTTDDSNPATNGDPGTCGYGEFDGTSDGYVQIDDPGTGSILDLSPDLSVAVWIYPTALPSSGLATIVSKDENFEFHLDTSGRINWWWGGGSRSMTSTGTVTLNTWNHITITHELGSQVIYINGVSQGTNNSSAAITLNNDALFIGTDLAFHSRRFTGFIDEVKVYDEALSIAQVGVVMAQTHACSESTTDHFAIFHSGTGVTCEAEVITITGHDSSDTGVDVGASTIQITATSATAGWTTADTTWLLGSGTGSFSTPSAGVAQYQFGTGETSVVLSFSNSSEAVIDFDVEDTSDPSLTDADGGVEDPTLSFSDTGFRFYNDANGDGNRDGTDAIASPLTAGITSGQLILRAVETNSDTGACIARVTGAQTVNMGYQCENPTTCVRADDADISGTAIGENDLGITSNLNAVSLTFDADGEAPFTFEYYDAGSVRLVASLPLAASGNEPAFTLFGSSDATIVKPADLVITQVTGNPSTTTSGSGFVTSGSLFTTIVQARNYDGGTTPNFGNETSSEGIILIEQVLIMPAGGTLTALTSPSTFDPTGTAGEFENTDLRWNQAGTFTMRAQIADLDYLGEGDVTGTTSGNIGRFYPDHFDLTSSTLIQGCAAGGFTFMSDQSYVHRPMDALFSISALSVLSSGLTNYDAALGYPVRGFTAVAENANNGSDLSGRAFIAASTWGSGIYAFSSTNNAGFSRDLSGLNEIVNGPYSSIQLGLVVDASGPDPIDFMSADLTMHPGQPNNCVSDGDCIAAAISSTANLVFGRLYGRSSHGPESAALAVPLETQFWDGSEYQTAAGDTCTAIAATATLFDGSSISTDANRTVVIGGSNSTGSFDNLAATVEFTMVAGEAGLEFSAPGAGNTDSFIVSINLNNYPWLRSDWNNDADNADDTFLPSLVIQFGSYRGHDRVIFWNEVLN